MSILTEFKAFIQRGSAIDMAVGIVIGSVTATMVDSLVKDIIMPPVGMLIGGVDFSNWFIVINQGLGEMVSDLGGGVIGQAKYATVAAANAAGAVTMNIGLFINSLVTFLITMFAVFMFVKIANKIRGVKPAATPTTYACPYCKKGDVEKAATICPYCCSKLKPVK